MKKDEIHALILEAFASVERPGNWALVDSNEGTEPGLVIEEFKDKADWHTLDAAFLDQAPAGFSSALSFLSNEAFRYFLPAYLLADLDDKLTSVELAPRLCRGLDDTARNNKINPRRYGDRTWFDQKKYQFSTFTAKEARAILSYLQYKSESDDDDRKLIEEAIRNYWKERAGQ